MLKAAAERGWLNEKDAVLEALLCLKRAGSGARPGEGPLRCAPAWPAGRGQCRQLRPARGCSLRLLAAAHLLPLALLHCAAPPQT